VTSVGTKRMDNRQTQLIKEISEEALRLLWEESLHPVATTPVWDDSRVNSNAGTWTLGKMSALYFKCVFQDMSHWSEIFFKQQWVY